MRLYGKRFLEKELNIDLGCEFIKGKFDEIIVSVLQ